MKTQTVKTMFQLAMIGLAILSVIVPIIAYWHIELTMEFKRNIVLTNGYLLSEPMKIYHNHMWLVFITSFASAVFIIYTIMHWKWEGDKK